MSKPKYRIDLVKRVIYVEANYLKLSQNPRTRAYETVSGLIAKHPTFEVKAEGVAKDRYNHLTYQSMETFFIKSGMDDALKQLNAYRSDKTVENRNGKNVRVHNMGFIRSWFIKNYGAGAGAQGNLKGETAGDSCAAEETAGNRNAAAGNEKEAAAELLSEKEPGASEKEST